MLSIFHMLIIWIVLWIWFWCHILRNPYLHHDHKDFLLYFLFKFLCFMFHIKLILTNAKARQGRYGLKFFCVCMCVWVANCSIILCWNLLLFTQLPLHFCSKINCSYICVCVSFSSPVHSVQFVYTFLDADTSLYWLL